MHKVVFVFVSNGSELCLLLNRSDGMCTISIWPLVNVIEFLFVAGGAIAGRLGGVLSPLLVRGLSFHLFAHYSYNYKESNDK